MPLAGTTIHSQLFAIGVLWGILTRFITSEKGDLLDIRKGGPIIQLSTFFASIVWHPPWSLHKALHVYILVPVQEYIQHYQNQLYLTLLADK